MTNIFDTITEEEYMSSGSIFDTIKPEEYTQRPVIKSAPMDAPEKYIQNTIKPEVIKPDVTGGNIFDTIKPEEYTGLESPFVKTVAGVLLPPYAEKVVETVKGGAKAAYEALPEAIKGGVETVKEAVKPVVEPYGKVAKEVWGGLGEIALGTAADTAQFAATVPVGLKGLYKTIGAGVDVGAEDISRSQEAVHHLLSYEPATEVGKAGLGAMRKFFELFAEAGEYWGEKVEGGGAAVQAATNTFFQVSPLFVSKLVKVKSDIAKARAIRDRPLTSAEKIELKNLVKEQDKIIHDWGQKLTKDINIKKVAEEIAPPQEIKITPLDEKIAPPTMSVKEQAKLPPEKNAFNDIVWETAKSVDDFIAPTPVGLSMADVSKGLPLGTDRITLPKNIKLGSVSPEVEMRWQNAKITDPSFGERAVESLKNLKNTFTRSFIHLDPKEFAPEIDILRRLRSVPETAKLHGSQAIKGITAGLGKRKLDVFTRNIVLPDLIKGIDKSAKIRGEGESLRMEGQRLLTDADNFIRESKKLGEEGRKVLRDAESLAKQDPDAAIPLFERGNGLLAEADNFIRRSKEAKTKGEKYVKDGDNMIKDNPEKIFDGGYNFGYKNRGEMIRDLNNFNAVAEANPEIVRSIGRRKKFMTLLKSELVHEGLLDPAVLADDVYFHRQVLKYANEKRSLGLSRKGESGFQKARGKDKHGDFNVNYIESEFEWIAQAISKLETAKSRRALKKTADIYDSVIEKAKAAGDEANWERHIPEGYKAITMPELNRGVTESLLDSFVKENTGKDVVTNYEIQDFMRPDSKTKPWVVREELAQTLKENFNNFSPSWLAQQSQKLMTTWKQWTLLNPFSALRYNINNMSGDLDIALAYDPRILKETKAAFNTLYPYTRGKGVTPKITEYIQKSIMDSGMSIHEIPDISREGFFKTLTGENPNLIEKYWNTTKDYTNMRENLLRVAAYEHFKKELAAGKRPYAASSKAEIDALYKAVEEGRGIELNDVAAKLSRELIGDYGNLSVGGQWLRSNLIPFYSWMEINAPRYVRLFKNAPYEGKSKGRALTAATWRTGAKVGGLVLRAQILYGMMSAWNKTMYPEEEARLSDAQKKQLHIILGTREDGSIMSLKFAGALSDALSWAGLEDYPQDIAQLVKGETTLGKKGVEALKAPIQRLATGLRPEKSAIEIATGKTLYPDVFSPRPIRDRAEYLAKTFSMAPVYKYLAGKPTKGFDADLTSLLFQITDPGEASYYTAMQMKEDKTGKIDKAQERSNALYYYKQAVKFGDKDAEKKYYDKYMALGGTKKGMKKSVEMIHPLAGMSKKDRREYLDSLTIEERDIVLRAEAWYDSTYRRK